MVAVSRFQIHTCILYRIYFTRSKNLKGENVVYFTQISVESARFNDIKKFYS